MGTDSILRWRRNAAQLDALASVEREIRATDPKSRRKYLRAFTAAYPRYEAVLSAEELAATVASADVLLVGDYHALPKSQRQAAVLLRQIAAAGRPVVLGLETVFARDQHILDEWLRGEIHTDELRERIRFDSEWGYEWTPFAELLLEARALGASVYGLDCMPRNDLRRIALRDRHAAAMLGDIRGRHPGAGIVVLFGESHLAPEHLPHLIGAALPQDRVVTVLQNVDQLYWQAAGERGEGVEAVRVRDGVICLFNSTPLEKYESYRLCIERWRRERGAPDITPSIYNLIGSLLRFLHVDRYAGENARQPAYIVDLLPEVCCRPTPDALKKALYRKGATDDEVQHMLRRVEEHGICYLPRRNTLFATEFQMEHGAEEAAHFVHHACRGALLRNPAAQEALSLEDVFYAEVLNDALGYFGSRVLYPARPPARESDLYARYAQPRHVVEEQTLYSYREYMEMLDFLVLHKDYETNYRRYWNVPPLISNALRYTGERLDFVTQRLGYMLGSELYDAWLAGRVSKRYLRALYFRRLERPGIARASYFDIVRRTRPSRRKPATS